jgi:hypothetical protein
VARCSRYKTAVKANAVIITALLGLICLVACADPHHRLSDPAKFRTIEHALRGDLTKVNLDLQREARDARPGASGKREPRCYNLKNNVNYSALVTIHNFAVTTVAVDRQSMQNNINHLRRDRSGFQRDIFDFINDGVARPAGANKAIAEISQKIIQAKATANRIISEVNDDIRRAYAIANHLATGRCRGDGPGSQVPQVPPVT